MASYTPFIAANKKDRFLRHAAAFYTTYKAELVPLSSGASKGVQTMLDLLQLLGKRQKTHVLIVSHGWTDGLWLPVRKDGEKATTDRIAMIFLLEQVRSAFSKLLEDKQPEKWFASKSSTQAWLGRLELVFPSHEFSFASHGKALSAMKGKSKGGSQAYQQIEQNVQTLQRNPDRLGALGAQTQQSVRQWWSALLTSSDLGDRKTADAYFDALRKVRSVRISSAEIRGCRIGKSEASSQALRRFLNARKLRAPTVDLETVHPTVKLAPKRTASARGQRWSVSSGWVEWNPGHAYYASSLGAWSDWIDQKVGTPRKKTQRKMPIIFNGKPPTYLLDASFSKLLKAYS